MTDLYIRVDNLNRLNGTLKQILIEFATVSENTGLLQDLVARPDGRTSLQNKVSTFESGWSSRRRQLNDKLTEMQKLIEEVCTGWEDFDNELTAALSLTEDEVQNLPEQ